jgi:hypothetical protein
MCQHKWDSTQPFIAGIEQTPQYDAEHVDKQVVSKFSCSNSDPLLLGLLYDGSEREKQDATRHSENLALLQGYQYVILWSKNLLTAIGKILVHKSAKFIFIPSFTTWIILLATTSCTLS